jgi:hypothetical protein
MKKPVLASIVTLIFIGCMAWLSHIRSAKKPNSNTSQEYRVDANALIQESTADAPHWVSPWCTYGDLSNEPVHTICAIKDGSEQLKTWLEAGDDRRQGFAEREAEQDAPSNR